MTVKVSLKTLLETGAHFGHQSRRWNPKMADYLYGIQEGVHVFDLIKTKKALDEALQVLSDASKAGKKILILGTKKQAKKKTDEVGRSAGCFYVTERWLGGTLTNFNQIQKSIRKLTEMKEKMAQGEYKQFTKKERLLIEREIARLERFFGGIVEMKDLPDILVIIDTKREHAAVKEADMKNVTTIGIVDSNADPTRITHPIPMNDDATRAVEYVLELFGEAIKEGSTDRASGSGSTGEGKGKKKAKSKLKKKTEKK